MQYRRLGNSGLQVSILGLGTNSFGGRADEAAARRILDTAIDGGVNFIDTANIYTGGQSETIIGKALKGKRHDVLIATKGGGRKGRGESVRLRPRAPDGRTRRQSQAPADRLR